MENAIEHVQHDPWNKGVIVGQKSPFKLKEIWAIRVRLQLQHRVRELAMFNLGLDSKLRACDLVKMRVRDICHGEHVSPRTTVMQQKTSRPQFNSKLPKRPVTQTVTGSKQQNSGRTITCFPAAFISRLTLEPVNTPALLILGSQRLGLIPPNTGHIQCGERRHL